jgi:hypothetical protein
MWSLVLVSKLVTTFYCSSHYNLHLMAGRLAPASEVAGRAWSSNFKMVWYVLCPPATSEAGAKWPRISANYSDSSTKL